MNSRNLDPAVSPLRVFGAMLRHYRVHAGMSQEQLGARVRCSGDLIGKIENGQRAPGEQLTRACDELAELKTGGALGELRALLKNYLKERAFPGWFQDWPGNEAHAKILRWFELVAVPGLLQTEDYARAMLRTQVLATDDETDEKVAARMDRQVILTRDNPPMLWVLLDEGVLRRPVGGREVMAGQLRHLVESAASRTSRPDRRSPTRTPRPAGRSSRPPTTSPRSRCCGIRSAQMLCRGQPRRSCLRR